LFRRSLELPSCFNSALLMVALQEFDAAQVDDVTTFALSRKPKDTNVPTSTTSDGTSPAIEAQPAPGTGAPSIDADADAGGSAEYDRQKTSQKRTATMSGRERSSYVAKSKTSYKKGSRVLTQQVTVTRTKVRGIMAAPMSLGANQRPDTAAIPAEVTKSSTFLRIESTRTTDSGIFTNRVTTEEVTTQHDKSTGSSSVVKTETKQADEVSAALGGGLASTASAATNLAIQYFTAKPGEGPTLLQATTTMLAAGGEGFVSGAAASKAAAAFGEGTLAAGAASAGIAVGAAAVRAIFNRDGKLSTAEKAEEVAVAAARAGGQLLSAAVTKQLTEAALVPVLKAATQKAAEKGVLEAGMKAVTDKAASKAVAAGVAKGAQTAGAVVGGAVMTAVDTYQAARKYVALSSRP
jgi:hypothetical protein